MTTLTNANREWSTRRPDERFKSIADMHAAAKSYPIGAQVAKIKADALRVTVAGDELALTNGGDKIARLTNWSAGQLATRAGAPRDYIETLPTALAASCLQH